LVDDEQVILQGLLRVLPWEDYGCRVVGTASDGLEGAALIRKLKPDILTTEGSGRSESPGCTDRRDIS